MKKFAITGVVVLISICFFTAYKLNYISYMFEGNLTFISNEKFSQTSELLSTVVKIENKGLISGFLKSDFEDGNLDFDVYLENLVINDEETIMEFRIFSPYSLNSSDIVYMNDLENKKDSTFSISVEIGDKSYEGRIISEGPNTKNGLVFRVLFSAMILEENTEYMIKLSGLTVNHYNRK